MNILRLKGVIIEMLEQREEMVVRHISMRKQVHLCSNYGEKTVKVHDYRTQSKKS